MPELVDEATRRKPVSDFVGRWRHGERESVRELLSREPGLKQQKSLVLDLAYEEFCLRRESGETVLPSTFCEQFPVYRHSLRKLLATHGYFWGERRPLKNVPVRWPEPGEQYLGFDLLDELGKGAFAKVYLARQDEFGGRLVALKVAPCGASEVRTLGRLPHPNIVPVYSLTPDDELGLTAVCMPFLGRATLYDLLDEAFGRRRLPVSAEVILRVAEDPDAPLAAADLGERRLSPRETYVDGIIRLVRQLAEALAYVHKAGVLHLDLKPSNVLLVPGGVPMLLDFNLSVELSAELRGVGGTLPYMPPEFLRCLRGEREDKAELDDPRTDIFALGVIFHELLTGVLPFGNPEPNIPNDEGARQLLSAQARGVPPAARRNPQVEPEIDGIIARCVASEPARRYSSAADLAADLRHYLSAPKRRARWRRRHRRAILSGAAAFCLAASAGGGWWAYHEAIRLPDLEQGFLDYERGDYGSALACFERHLSRQPNDAEGLFARGQAHRALGDLEAAERDYMSAAKYSEAGEIQACGAYCVAMRDRFSLAMKLSEDAIAKGYDTAVVRNNLAYAQMKNRGFEKAAANLSRAIALDGDLYAARHNRAQLAVRAALVSRRPPEPQAIEDADRALKLGKPTTQLLADAAALYGLAAKGNPALRPQAEDLLESALKLGLAERQVRSDPAFAETQKSSRIQKLLDANISVVPPSTADLLAEPPTSPRLSDF